MIKTFQFELNELDVKLQDIQLLMSTDEGELMEPFPALIKEGLTIVGDYCEIKGGYQLFPDVIVDRTKANIEIKSKTFYPGKIITTQLKKSSFIALFICTAGKGISTLSKKLMDEGDLIKGYVYDVIGSVIVEKAMDKIQEMLENEMKQSGLGISNRYSPGYCDWDVADQKKLFSFFPENFCGVSLSTSSLMNPIKSVSGIIGIGKELKQRDYQCNLCNDQYCIYGKMKRKNKSSLSKS